MLFKKSALVLSSLLILHPWGAYAAEKEHHAPHWSYKGSTGEKHWAELDASYETCKKGMQQSPIDIRQTVPSQLPDLNTHYQPTLGTMVNNGHTIQVNLKDPNTLKVKDTPYVLKQFHFHSPSEQRIKGKTYPMELHMVHASENGALAVVGVLFKVGRENPALADVFSHMPTQHDAEFKLTSALDPNTLLPADRDYVHYVGSLTTPPCSEGVEWFVMKHPVEISRRQLDAFRKIYPSNARHVQPLHGRKVED